MLIRLTLHASLLVACLASQLARAEVKEYIRDYNYQGEPYDTAATCRVNAIDGVKRELLDELGTYVGSVVKQHQDSLGNSYMSHDVVNITAGIVALRVLDEKWKQPVYFVKAGMKADPDDVLVKLKAMRADLELEKNLRESYEELERARNEVAQLKAQLAQLKLAGTLSAVNTEVAPPISVKPAPVPVVKQLQAMEEKAQQNLAKDTKEENAVPAAAPVQLASRPKVAVPISTPAATVTAPAPAIRSAGEQASAQKSQAELARDAEALKVAQPAVPALPVPATVKVAAATEADKLVGQYAKAVRDVEVGEAFQRAMALRMNGDFTAMFKEMSALADKGYAKAQHKLGWIHERGLGVQQDYQKAREWYLKAAANGDADANAYLGRLYEHGWGVEKDYGRAAELYMRAINDGSTDGLVRMGYLHETGKGVPLSKDKAVEYYQHAVDKGNHNGLARLGLMYQTGEGVGRNERKAAALYTQAIDHGDPLAMTRLSMMHVRGIGGVSKDHEKAIALLREAIKYKLPATYAYMGYVYLNGYGVKQDYEEARKYLEKGAELDAPFAEFLLAKMYKDGRGVTQDKAKAKYWFDRAASKGFDISSHIQ